MYKVYLNVDSERTYNVPIQILQVDRMQYESAEDSAARIFEY